MKLEVSVESARFPPSQPDSGAICRGDIRALATACLRGIYSNEHGSSRSRRSNSSAAFQRLPKHEKQAVSCAGRRTVCVPTTARRVREGRERNSLRNWPSPGRRPTNASIGWSTSETLASRTTPGCYRKPTNSPASWQPRSRRHGRIPNVTRAPQRASGPSHFPRTSYLFTSDFTSSFRLPSSHLKEVPCPKSSN